MRKKQKTRRTIIATACRLFGERGFNGVTIAEIMQACGLSHGGFYAHFSSKAELERIAFTEMAENQRQAWFAGLEDASISARLTAITARYLSPEHRDDWGGGCAFSAHASDIGRRHPEEDVLKNQFEEEIATALDFLQEAGVFQDRDQAMAYLALLSGGITLARALGPSAVSDQLIRAVRAAGIRFLKQ